MGESKREALLLEAMKSEVRSPKSEVRRRFSVAAGLALDEDGSARAEALARLIGEGVQNTRDNRVSREDTYDDHGDCGE